MQSSRPSVRVVCLDPENRMLLMLWRDPASGELIWEPPGGGIEDDETPLEAAVREVREETGIHTAQFSGPFLLVWRDYVWNGKHISGEEAFFLAGLPEPTQITRDALMPNEQECLVETRWVRPDTLSDLAERVEPPDLATIIAALTAADSN